MRRVRFLALTIGISALSACGSSGSSTGNNTGGGGGLGAIGGSSGNTGAGAGAGTNTGGGGATNSSGGAGGSAANSGGGAGGVSSTAGAGGNSTAGGNGNVGGTTGAGGAACQANVACTAFPSTFVRGCTNDDSCVGEVHQIDCCGARRVLGMNHSEANTFCPAEATCRAQYPSATCTSDMVITDGGAAPSMDHVAAKCADITQGVGTCTTYVCNTSTTPACPTDRRIGTCG